MKHLRFSIDDLRIKRALDKSEMEIVSLKIVLRKSYFVNLFSPSLQFEKQRSPF